MILYKRFDESQTFFFGLYFKIVSYKSFKVRSLYLFVLKKIRSVTMRVGDLEFIALRILHIYESIRSDSNNKGGESQALVI
jgi:hypothetical protein